jgi:ferric-dicitrate binding protein FerR (iron transport regulator)
MENSNQINELLVRFLTNGLNDEEHSQVVDWINTSDENRRYFIHLRNTWQLTAVKLTAQVNEEEEWSLFQETIAARDAKVVSMQEHEEQGIALLEENERQQRSVIYRRLARFAVAAAVLMVVGVGAAYFFKNNRQQPVVATTEKTTDDILTVVQHEVNTTGKEKSITLSDGTVIVLFNNSELTYRKPFTKRDVTLSGKALFKIAKDSTRPFRVESGAITTTALGTEFIVTAVPNDQQMTVRLYNGRVVIKPVEKANNLMKKDVYLSPGQEFVYGPNTTTVRTFGANNNVKLNKDNKSVVDNPSLPSNTKGSWHMYNNQPLAQVLDHLSSIYGVLIVYEQKDVQQKYFVGQFKTTDSIEIILKLITKANKLKYTREDSTYIIHH